MSLAATFMELREAVALLLGKPHVTALIERSNSK